MRLIYFIVLSLVLLSVFIYVDTKTHYSDVLKEKVDGPFAYAIFVLLVFISALFEIIPFFAFVALGGFLFGFAESSILSLIGLLAGSLVVYKLEKKRVKKNKLSLETLFVSRLIPLIPNNAIAIMATTKLNLRDFIVFTIIGALPQILIFASFGEGFREPEVNILFIIFAILCSLGMGAYLMRFDLQRIAQKRFS